MDRPELPHAKTSWVPLSRSAAFLFSHFRVVILSLVLFLATLALTWIFYQVSIHYIDLYIGSHFPAEPATGTLWGWIKHQGWLIFRLIFSIIANLIVVYVGFSVAYCLTSPGYSFLSALVEKINYGAASQTSEGFTLRGLKDDLIEGCKIGLFGIGVTIAALFINFIPGIGQFLIFCLYCYYSCLMFIDYPASRRRWSLGKKLGWLKSNPWRSLRLGIIPALICLVPVVNIFLMSLIFPLFTIHSTLNFSAIENTIHQPE